MTIFRWLHLNLPSTYSKNEMRQKIIKIVNESLVAKQDLQMQFLRRAALGAFHGAYRLTSLCPPASQSAPLSITSATSYLISVPLNAYNTTQRPGALDEVT